MIGNVPAVPWYANAEMVYLPYRATLQEIIDYAKYMNVTYLIIRSVNAKSNPNLKNLFFDPQSISGNLRLIRSHNDFQ